MRVRIGVAAVLLLVACGRASGPAVMPEPTSLDSATAAAAQEIHQLQAEWRDALAAKDTAFFGRTLMDDFLLTGDETVTSKAQYIQQIIENADTLPTSRPLESALRIHGDVAVVTGLIAYSHTGSAVPLEMRYTEVWLKREGRWLAFHGHYNPLLRPSLPQTH